MIKHARINVKKTALIAVFAALTITLNLSPIKIAAPYAPYLIYQAWEIPIVAAFMLYGLPVGILIAIINMLILFVVFPGALPTGPMYNFAAIVSMLFGMLLPKLIHKNPKRSRKAAAAVFTAFGIIFRVGVMTVFNWTFLRFPPPLGFGLPEPAIIASFPFIAFFNATLALYTIPLAYAIAETVKLHVKV